MSAQRSEAQANASRLNGAQSTGPVSEEGKAKSAQNASRHGLCSGRLVFDDAEAEAAFGELLGELTGAYQPVNEAERICVQRLAQAEWRARICTNMEFVLLCAIDRGEACAMKGGLGLPSLNTILRYQSRIRRERQEVLAELEGLRMKREEPIPAMEVRPAAGIANSAINHVHLAQRKPCTNEPGTPARTSGLNREQRRRLEAIGRKQRK